MTLKEELAEVDPDLLFADGLDAALIGTVSLFTSTGIVETALYDLDKCREILIADGMTWEEADEYLSFNTLGAYVGEKTPAFATIKKD